MDRQHLCWNYHVALVRNLLRWVQKDSLNAQGINCKFIESDGQQCCG